MSDSHVKSVLHTSARALVMSPVAATSAPAPTPRLMRWLDARARQNGHKQVDVARALGVTYGYLAQLRSGIRATSQISVSFARACAVYLDVPAALVLLAADRLSAADFCEPGFAGSGAPGSSAPASAAVSAAVMLRKGLERMAADPWVGCLMPAEVHDAPVAVQQLLLALYEDATQTELFAQRRRPQLFWSLSDACIVADEADGEEFRARSVEVAEPAKAVETAAAIESADTAEMGVGG